MLGLLKKIPPQKRLALVLLAALYAFFAFRGVGFVSLATTQSILGTSYFIGFLAIGMTFVIISGGIDLSVGAVMVCSALAGGMFYRDYGWPLWLCIPVILLVGTAFGLINGILVTRLKLPPFIATLGTMMVSLGLGSIITNAMPKYFPGTLEADSWYPFLFAGTAGGFPTGLIFLLLFCAAAAAAVNMTKFGSDLFTIGKNEGDARQSGIKTHNRKFAAYIICGFCAGLAAVFYSAVYMAVSPNTGNGFELQAIAAAVIGGTSLYGGTGSVSGTVIGVFVISVLRNGLVSMGLPAPYQTIFTGGVVIGAVLLDISLAKKTEIINIDQNKEE